MRRHVHTALLNDTGVNPSSDETSIVEYGSDEKSTLLLHQQQADGLLIL